MVTLRRAAEQALAAIKSANQVNYSWACVEAVAALEAALAEEALQRLTDVQQEVEAALAEPHDPVAYDGWVLREVLFDNGEPVGHRAPDRHALQAEGKHPAPCARHCEAKAFEIEIRMLKAALAEPNKCTHGVTDGNCKECYMAEPEQEPVFDCPRCGHCCPQRKPLTDEEIEQAYRNIWRNIPADFDHTSMGWIEQGIRYAEQAHGIGEKHE